MTEPSHSGNDPIGAPTTHRGRLEDCPAPECQDQAADAEQAMPWGVYCPHDKQIVERDPDLTDPEGHEVSRLVTPWPCTVDGCTPEAFEASEQARENEYWESLMSEVLR